MHKSYNGPDRRRYIRIPEKDLLSHELLAVTSFDPEGTHKKFASTKDFSEGGLLFQSEILFPIGTYVRLQFYVHDWDKQQMAFYKETDIEKGPFTVVGKVVRAEILGRTNFEIGVEYVAVDTGHKQALKSYIKKIKPDA